ncbi:MAG: hypothetical protein JWN96_2394, partial [Mycobacterium sp.]|nr:hypothetical protein [Mycobacterium sp.]
PCSDCSGKQRICSSVTIAIVGPPAWNGASSAITPSGSQSQHAFTVLRPHCSYQEFGQFG